MATEKDPMIDPMRVSFARAALSRRTALTGLAAVAAAGFLTACGSPGKNPAASTGTSASAKTPAVAPDLSDTEKLINWSNWPAYMDVAGSKHPTLDAFTKQTGIKVNYIEDYNDNDTFYAKMRPYLDKAKDTGRDLWCSTDWMVARLMRLGFVLPLDKANIPNAANLVDSLANVTFDPGRAYSLPWQSGFAGIAYNPDITGGKAVTSMDQLLHDPVLKGKVTLLTEMRDTVGLVMMEQGKKLDSFTAEDFAAAIAVIQEAKDAGQLRGFTGNEFVETLPKGAIAACVGWTGDIAQAKLDNPKIAYTLPEKGFTLWSDNFVIPAMAKHKKNAETLINYYYSPEVMAKVVAYVNYISPVKGTKDLVLKADPSLSSNQLMFPDDATMARAQVFRSLTAAEETSFNKQFQALVTG